MITVCDASPLIFLAKIRRLELLPDLFPGEILVPDDVQRELVASPIPPAEEAVLETFLRSCQVVRIRPKGFRSTALSTADRTVLTLAVREGADRVLADDRLLRDLVEVEGMKPIGTLGVLVLAMRKKRLSAPETRSAIDELVRDHGFRIGIALYERMRVAIDEESG